MKKTLFGLLPLALLAACGGGAEKKVLVMVKGSVSVAKTDNTITVKEGTGYSEEEIELKGNKPTTLTAKTSDGKSTTIDVPAEPGYYILSLRSDTVVGSFQQSGTESAGGQVISQESLKQKIDSLDQLTKGANVSAANHNYLVAPNQLVKVTDNAGARIFGPFRRIPAAGVEPPANGKPLEIYKFSTNNEVRETIEKLKKMTQ
ncbi:hypothetical protein [Filimonas effusa]|uniref:Uncharacterized protein n=1 Tax=Filimonas effusa TaxID=2508721 RepID=A0A4Q1CZV1_9BACT|nr:hypothetical protein [Filimonas effusa]RXK80856.1 hypothetical protein ESB13_22135 [Filimonas effusa]